MARIRPHGIKVKVEIPPSKKSQGVKWHTLQESNLKPTA